MILRVLIILIVSRLSLLASDESTVLILNGQEEIAIAGEAIGVYIDEERTKDVQDAVTGMIHFTPNTTPVPNFGFYDGVVWLKFSVKNDTDKNQHYILEIKNPILDLIELYRLTDSSEIRLAQTGDYMPFSQRPIQHKNFLLPVKIPAGESITYLLKVNNHGQELSVPLKLWKERGLAKRDYSEQYILGVYYGIILFVFFLNLFIYLIIMEKANLYYLFYLMGLALLQLSLGGQAFQWLWPNSPFWANHSQAFLASIAVLALVQFCRHFLDTKTLMPLGDKFFVWISYVIVGIMVISVIDYPPFFKTSILGINAVTLLLNIIIIPTAIIALKRHYKSARFFLIAFILLIISVFGFILKNFGLVPSNFVTEFGIQIGSALETILLSFAIVDKFKMFKDEAVHRLEEVNKLKSEQNIVLERQVKERTKEIEAQKEELAEKNKDILDSIRYAKRIQLAILPPEEITREALRDHFILYKPKDIVSGDFYWVESADKNNILFAAVDCTGHGVPGAFMSIIGYNGLNRAVRESHLLHPAAILDELNQNVGESLRQNQEDSSAVKDGMDITLCSINYKEMTLEYAGANNPLYIIRKGELIETKANKQPIGPFDSRKPFTNHQFKLEKGDTIYIFSDGYADQFGGPEGKKFKYKNFKELLISIQNKSMPEQNQILDETIENWKGTQPQIDDILVMGVRV